MSDIRARIAQRLRFLADRLDDPGAIHAPGKSFTIEPGRGFVIHDNDRIGCRLWYIGRDYDRAFTTTTEA